MCICFGTCATSAQGSYKLSPMINGKHCQRFVPATTPIIIHRHSFDRLLVKTVKRPKAVSNTVFGHERCFRLILMLCSRWPTVLLRMSGPCSEQLRIQQPLLIAEIQHPRMNTTGLNLCSSAAASVSSHSATTKICISFEDRHLAADVAVLVVVMTNTSVNCNSCPGSSARQVFRSKTCMYRPPMPQLWCMCNNAAHVHIISPVVPWLANHRG